LFTLKKITGLFMLLIIGSVGAFAQAEEKVSDGELKQFASAFQHVQNINQQAQQEMAKAVEGEGLGIQRFNEIQQARQDPAQEASATEEEIEMFNSAYKEIEEIQRGAQQKMQEKIVEEGLTIPRYQEIATSIQASPELQQKIQEYLKG